MYTDASCLGNPGMSGIGVLLLDFDEQEVARLSMQLGIFTNNVAEYLALIHGLMWLPRVVEDPKSLEIFTDSRLMAMQVRDEFRVRNAALRPLHQMAHSLLSQLQSWSITHIPREQNTAADKLATEALKRHGK
jgi:ribonuclease HI